MTTTVKPSDLLALLMLCIPAHEPVLITGKPGIGKTDIIAQACAAVGADLIVSHPVVNDPTDYKGLPYVVDGGATFMPFGELKDLINATKLTVYFMDDLGQATPAVQAAAMQLILARRINGHKVSDHVVFLAATNRRADRAGVTGILEPVKSRFASIVELDVDFADWRKWALAHGIREEVIAYLSMKEEYLCDFKPTADLVNSPSPRTWSAVSRLLNLNLPSRLMIPAIEGAIGASVAGEFVSFLRIWQSLISPSLILSAPDTAPLPTEPSASYAVMTAIAKRVQTTSMGAFCRYNERMIASGRGDMAAVSVKTALARTDAVALTNTPAYIKAAAGPIGQLLIGG